MVERGELVTGDPDLLVVALNGYRHDCLDAMVFATRDAGKSWEDWGQHLPHEPVNALVERGPRGLVDAMEGTDGGAYLTTDAGTSFSMLHQELPRVPVHDLVIQERENDLVIGTHGRGIYVLDLSPLMDKAGSPDAWGTASLAFEEEAIDAVRASWWGERGWAWSEPEDPVVNTWVWSDEAARASN